MGTATQVPDGRWFEQLANSTDTLFYVLRVQPDLAFEYINDAIENLFGWSAAAVLADPRVVLDVIAATDAGLLTQVLALTPGTQTVAEFNWRHRNGHWAFGRTYVRAQRRDDGSIVLEGATRDVTQLHDTQVELQSSEKRYRLLVEHAFDVVWTAAIDGTLTYLGIVSAWFRRRGCPCGSRCAAARRRSGR